MDYQPRRVHRGDPRLRTSRRRSRRRTALIAFLSLALVGGAVGAAAIATDSFGAGVLYQRAVAPYAVIVLILVVITSILMR